MTPQADLDGGVQVGIERFDRDEPDLSKLTDAERDAYRAVEIDGLGVREWARTIDRSPGTVGNLLARAREKVGDDL